MSHSHDPYLFKRTSIGLFAGLAALAFAGVVRAADSVFAPDYNSIVAAAAKEGAVHACSILDENEFKPILSGFKAMFPNVPAPVYERCNGVEPRERILNEYASGQVFTDIFDAGDDLVTRAADSGFAETPNWNVFDGTPLELDKRVIASNGNYANKFVAGGSWSPVIVYNTKLLNEADAPKSFADCADPKWRGQFMIDVRPIQFPAFAKVWGEDKFRKWAKAVGQNDPMWTRGSNIFARLSTGERKFHCGYTVAAVLRAVEGGASNLAYRFAEQTPSMFAQRLMVAKGTRSPNAALLLIAYWASKPGQLKLEEGNPGYGSPFISETWMSKQIKESGTKLIETGWDYSTYSDDALKTIIESWGFPQPPKG